MKKTLLFVLCLLLSWGSFAQNDVELEDIDIDEFIQNLFPVQDENLNYADAYESLFQLYTNPLDLNTATKEELKALYILSEIQINSLVAHREKYGEFLSIYELQAVENLDVATIKKILPFVRITPTTFAQDNRSLFKRILAEKNNFLLLRYERDLEQRQGYKPLTPADTTSAGLPKTRYLGNADKYYVRFRTSHIKDFSIGFTAEKDAGEPFNFQNRNGFDFTSFHVAVYNRKKIKALVIGDYQLQVGQGLLLSAGFVVGKGAETTLTVRRSTTGIRPYTSVLESGFMRGGAVTYQLSKRWDATAFVSSLLQDGNVQNVGADTIADENDFLNSIIRTGYHRTPSENAKKDQLRETTYGGHLRYVSRNQNADIGFTLMNTNFSAAVRPTPRNYNQFEFSGTQNANFGVNGGYIWRNTSFFGEAAMSSSGGTGVVVGLVSALTTKLDIAILHRRFDKNLHTFYGNAFSEGTRNINEVGTYWGIKFKPNKKWTLAAYYDHFSFPWLRFLVDAPSNGYEYLARVSYQPSRTMLLYAQFREEEKGRNLRNNDSRIDYPVPSRKRNVLLNADWTVKEGVFLRSRVQLSSYQQQGQTETVGFLIAQDATIDYKQFQLSTRFAIFDTDDFDNRQYMFEKNVLYAFALPAYYGRGFRNYYLIRYKPHKKWSAWLRYAYTAYRDIDKVSSGLETINGNVQSEITVQVMVKL
jgi:hypothetical protein